MTVQTQTRTIKCPHCGWEREITLHIEAGKVDVVAGPPQFVQDLKEKLKNFVFDQELQDANAWIVMKACPNPPCGKTYEYNLRSGETRK